MTPDQIAQARNTLGLTQAQLGKLLDTDGQSVRRMEMPEDASTHRKPAPRMVRLIQAYLDGYRPSDWPDGRHKQQNTFDAGLRTGYVIALCNVVGLHDEPGIAGDALLEFGFGAGDIAALGLEDHDLELLAKMVEDRPDIAPLVSHT